MIEQFDYVILQFWHQFAYMTHGVFTPLMRFISFFYDHGGIATIGICLVLCYFKKTRKIGMGCILAMACGALLTNIFIKRTVARPRPFQLGVEDYINWWKYVGAVKVSEYSFPSGHTTACMACMSTIYFYLKDKYHYSWLVFLVVVIMGISRNYFVVHYPTDILGGVVIGFIGAYCSYRLLPIVEEKISIWKKSS